MQFNRSNANGCPCMDCQDRHAGCHPECERYKAWRGIMNERMKKRAEERERYAMSDSKKKWIRQQMRRNKNKRSAGY